MNHPLQIRLARFLLQEKPPNLISPLQLFQLHSLVITSGLQFQHPSVLLSLLKLSLSNPSTIAHATKLFPRVQEPYKWNLMIRHASATSPFKALSLFRELRADKSSTLFYDDPFVYASVIKACNKSSASREGKSIHCRVIRRGLNYNVNVMNSLVSFYLGSANLSSYAAALFDSVPEKNVVIVNCMISRNVDRGKLDVGLMLFVEMMGGCFGSNLKSNYVTFLVLISGCVKFGERITGKVLHCCSYKIGFSCITEIGNVLIDFYAKTGCIHDAAKVFVEMPVKDLISWNSMIWGHANSGHCDQAFSLFRKMRIEDIGIDRDSLSCLLSACRDLSFGTMIHAHVKATGLECDVSVGTALINMYAKCRDLKTAKRLFDELPKQKIEYWNAMIHAYIDGGLAREALKLLDEIKARELQLDQVTLLGLIMACRDAGEIRHSNLIHSIMKDNDLLKGSLVLGNALIDMYAKCGRITKARAVFDSMPNKDVISWTSMIVGYAINGEGERSITTFKQMCDEKLVPNSVTFLGVLSACDHAGLVGEGMKLYNVMTKVYHIEPKIEHFGCVIDMLARAGKVEDAQMFIREMPIKANALVWRMLLNACRVHGHINIGLNSITELTQLSAYFDPSNLVISSNIYAEAGRWVDVVSRKDVMVVQRASRVAGKSYVSYLTE